MKIRLDVYTHHSIYRFFHQRPLIARTVTSRIRLRTAITGVARDHSL